MDSLMLPMQIMMTINQRQDMSSQQQGAITWKSKKQSTIALSTIQAKYFALCEAGREACWLQNLFKELGYPQQGPTVI